MNKQAYIENISHAINRMIYVAPVSGTICDLNISID